MPVLDVKQLKKIRGKRIDVSFTEPFPRLPVEDITPGNEAIYRLALTNIGDSISVEGTVTLDLHVHCNRCLGAFVYTMESKFQEIYFEREKMQPQHEGTDWVPFAGDEIDIMPDTVQTVVADLPMRFICREDCRGLCSDCGTDLNHGKCSCAREEIDPRLARLKDLL